MESFPKNQHVEDSLQQDSIKGAHGKRDRAKKVLFYLKSIYQPYSWPDDAAAIRAIERTMDKLRTLKSNKKDFEF